MELLEDRALLTAVYGPVSLEPPAVPPALKAWWLSRPAETATIAGAGLDSAFSQIEERALATTVSGPVSLGPFAVPLALKAWGLSRPVETATFAGAGLDSSFGQDPARSLDTPQHPMLSFSPGLESVSLGTHPILAPGSDIVQAIAAWKMDQNPDGTGSPPPFPGLSIRGIAAGIGPPERSFLVDSVFAKFRDELDGGLVRLSPRPFFPISPETDWQNGIDGNPTEFISVAESESHGESPSGSADRTESSPGEGQGHGQARAASKPPVSSSETPVSSVKVAVEVEPKAWAGETSLAAIVLSRGELEPGALFPHDELPELTALLSSLVGELLGEPLELPLPLSGPLQQVATLDPLDDSSLALTATLLTASGDPQGATTSGPVPVETDASLPGPPSWAGFVIGLDEAFEANRLAARRWPAATEPYGDGERHQAASEPPPTEASATVDEAIQLLDREESASPLLDELFLRAVEDADDEEAPAVEKSWRDAAGPASLSLAILPALWAERLGARPPQLERRRAPDNLDGE